MKNLSDYVTSWIRTAVPIGVGVAAAWIAGKIGFVIDDDSKANLVSVATGAAIGTYYTVARWAEQKWPAIGWLLGVPKKPKY